MSRMSVVVLVVLAGLWWALAGSVKRVMPPDRVVIQAGPPGGSFDTHARRYADVLRAQGLRVEVRHQEDSLRIIDRLDDAANGVHVGFTAQRVEAGSHPAVASVGVVELQPLFLFLRRGQPEPTTLAGLAGRRLVMPQANSATAQATRDVLARYGVTPANTTFSYTQMADAATALQSGQFDAGFFMLSPGNPVVRRLTEDPHLVMYSLADSVGIARNIDYLKPATLVRGAFDLRAPLPAHDVSLVGATVNVVVREDIHPAVLYALLQAMDEVHKGQTLVSDPGEYPRQTGAVLPVHPLALEWGKSGTPWLFTHLPPAVAGVVDAYWAPALAILALVSAIGTLQSLTGFIDGAILGVALQWLGWLESRVARGRRPGWLGRHLFRLVEPVVLRKGREQIARDRLEHLRPHM
ncbi:TRAP-type uncharacterized transport system, substrate-binding protein [Roseateles sp. YR242]|uniref:TAXI family TRAP transporter solute-binding subunit n=1 Tax=Roseateles sp. YR242 TaxID=1855305 RepID=UPI0008CD9A4D|nr:TAXI family TRAP transporter solute-binding subunit [Roseateles sp. YR242]SEL87747.1 TRAP-type uncharacterized transport system, substrate-binding protein [Roseateles sp. YR242]